MDEYISKEAALKKLCYKCNDELSEEPCEPSDCFMLEAIRSLPSADVAPVRHGRWMHEETESGFPTWKCSRCGHGTNYNPEGIDLYCYHCGAKMDGGDKNG